MTPWTLYSAGPVRPVRYADTSGRERSAYGRSLTPRNVLRAVERFKLRSEAKLAALEMGKGGQSGARKMVGSSPLARVPARGKIQ